MSTGTRIPWPTPELWQAANTRLAAALAAAAPHLTRVRIQAERLTAQMASLAREQQRLAAATCAWCPQICCLSATVWYDHRDLVQFHLAGLAPPPGQPRTDPQRICRYLGGRGCRLPRRVRPWICTWYICPTQRRRLRRDRVCPTPPLEAAVVQITARRRELAAAVEAVIGKQWAEY